LKNEEEILEYLKRWFEGAKKVVLAGIGNSIRMDDFVGVKIIQNLEGKVSEDVQLIECETVPESYLENIIEFAPTHVLLMDAAVLGYEPGEFHLLDPEIVADVPAVTTHMLPLRIFCEYIKKMTGAKISLLLIEPENTDFGEGLSKKVEAASELLTKMMLELFAQP
jgi:hydrogenase 3 maturation protease